MTDDELVGRKIFHDRSYSVMEILAVDPPMENAEDMGPVLKLRHLDTGNETSCNWVSEVGKEFILLPEGYPQENIDKLHQFSKLQSEVHDIVMDIGLSAKLDDPNDDNR